MARTITHIVVHHTAGSGGSVEEIRKLHKDRGFSDIGYHKLISNGKDIGGRPSTALVDGAAYPGRPEAIAGAHCSNSYGKHNAYTVAVSVAGNYENDTLTKAQRSSLAAVIAEWCLRYGIPCDREHVKGHREMSGHTSNDCPGRNIMAVLDQVVEAARKRVTGSKG